MELEQKIENNRIITSLNYKNSSSESDISNKNKVI